MALVLPLPLRRAARDTYAVLELGLEEGGNGAGGVRARALDLDVLRREQWRGGGVGVGVGDEGGGLRV